MENSGVDHHENELNLPKIGCISGIFFSVLYCLGMKATGNLITRPLLHQHKQPEHLTNLSELPEKCISAILSFTTPRDICRLAAVSTLFRSAANSDSVWNKFLPQQCYQILPRAVTPVAFASKRELYFRLCDSILIDEGRKIFWLERSTAKIGYMLSARELTIVWSDTSKYWRWITRDDSRFVELAELLKVCWLEIKSEIDCTLLSPDTEYTVVFVLKLEAGSYGFRGRAMHFNVTTSERELIHKQQPLLEGEGVANDGWMEVVGGEFIVRDGYSSVIFCMKDPGGPWKRGLLVDGVKIEPKST